MTVGVDLFSVQANQRIVFVAVVRKVLHTQTVVVVLLLIFTVKIQFIK